ncbi:unnamed protein product [Calicophoron daubneyi]|uniref:HMG box domain-containing protein n=1 Tax=Calicophoron daubneyi TaxID=300641 RepID=A0AAV2T9L1_CALDB
MWMQDCASCAAAKANGLQAWMRHLTDEHVLPTEWPSDRAARLTGATALRPYTTITESKKKRRKDSVPRPLNSFMLFAQHIRRNVLRVFSDASNSVISQQLGDLWRTVPRGYRNQYDEEANRLVKIHQLEFPNYKYQPKKRQTANSSVADHTRQQHGTPGQTTTTTREAMEVSRLYPRAPNKIILNTGSQFEHISHTLVSHKSKSVPFYNSTQLHPAIGRRTAVRNGSQGDDEHVEYNMNSVQNEQMASNASPSKQSSRFMLSRLEPKTVCADHHSSYQPIPISLSSVLPPLLTSSSKQGILHEALRHNSCDSAYASGINSSSSSSASSPVVGDLLSPAKSASVVGNCPKSSPTRRKIHFVPIRPQSQHLLPVCGVPTHRQRFLSANNSCGVSAANCESTSGHSPRTDSTVMIQVPPGQLRTNSVNIPVHLGEQTVHQLVTPMYVRLAGDLSEDFIFTLPPGTTIIQTMGEISPLPAQAVQSQGGRKSSADKGHSSVINPRPLQFVQPVRIMNFAGGSLTSEINVGTASSASPADTSPLTCSSNSSSSSAYSPLSGDVFLPSQQLVNYGEFKQEESTYHFSVSSDYNTQTDSEHSEQNDFDMDVDQLASEDRTANVSCTVSCGTSVNSVTDGLAGDWSHSPSHLGKMEDFQRQDVLLTTSSSIPLPASLSVDVLRTGSDSGAVVGSEISNSDLMITNEENFESSFDAMMNSIDITTFLPETFSNSDEYATGDLSTLTDHFGTSGTRVSDCTESEREGASLVDVDEMLNEIDRRTFIISNELSHSSKLARLGGQFFGQMKNEGDLNEIPYAKVSYFNSPLSDLDSLDKSSLFVLKPDWSLQS